MSSLGHLRRALIFSAAFTLLLPPTTAITQSYAISRDKNLRGAVRHDSSAPDSPDGYGPVYDSDHSLNSENADSSAVNAEGRAARRVSSADAEAAEALAAYEEAKRALASQKIEQEEMRIRALEARQQQRDATREQAELEAAVAAAETELHSAENALKKAHERGADASKAATVGQATKRKDNAARKLSAANAEARGNRPYVEEMEANVRDFEGAFVMAAREAGMAAERVKALRAEMVEKMERAAEAQSAWQSMVESHASSPVGFESHDSDPRAVGVFAA
ncbi:hypothetical protein CLOM_g7217 [Closterium sp. NIES-68]|nr:hypothetical protein CLOM_g7217 [Closterium sp. NIES-68]GJP79029.1 hypothetical protein CLOP_g9280 [Closterium sp. NIES-67]